MKTAIRPALVLAFSTLALSACGGEAEAPVETAPDAPEGISVSEGRLMLPAVSGNPGAVYFTMANESERDLMIRSAFVEGAESTTLHSTETWNLETDMQEVFQIEVPEGEGVTLEPGGLHVMAMGLQDGLEPGDEVEVTVTFVGGDKVSFPAEVRSPGDEGDGMGGMDHDGMDMDN